MARRLTRTAVFGFVAALCSTGTVQALPPDFQQETLLSGIGDPVNIKALPDGRMLLLRQNGRILIFDPDELPVDTSLYLQIANVNSARERGLASMALDPDFDSNGYIYVYYTSSTSNRNRISRFTHQGNSASPASEFVVWEDNEDWSDCCHYGGGMDFGPDGKLYLATGEEFDGAQAQDLGRAGGKIIRINKDGTIPNDNPFVDGPGGNLDEIWAYGLRNPYRAHWDLVDNRFYIGEVGGNVQSTAMEDLHIGRAGANYGWPFCEGFCSDPAYDDPVYTYGHTLSTPNGGAITAGHTYRGGMFPGEYNGAFFFGDYALSFIKYLKFKPNGSVDSVNDFATNVGAPVAFEVGDDGALYVVDYLGRVLRFTYNDGNQPPVIDSVTLNPTVGTPPLNVSFSVSASDPEDDDLEYRWIFGDGQEDNSGPDVNHTYTARGVYNAFVEVSDGSLSTFSTVQKVEVGIPPTVTIDAPVDGAIFRAGDTIVFSGSAADPDETIPAANYSWDVRFLHNAHTHPTLSGFTGTGGELFIETSGHDWHDDTGYEFTLEVTDSDGISRSDTVVIRPDKVDLSFATSPAGIPVFIDGLPQDAPFSYDTLIGFQHVIAVPFTHCMNGQEQTFVSWSDGGADTHQITVPPNDQTYTAVFAATGPCEPLPESGLVLHLESDSGVQTTASTVTGWADASGQDNDLAATGAPTLIAGALNGQPAIGFDGVDDTLERTATLSGLPAGSSDRTAYMVVDYRDNTGFGGFAYGTGQGPPFTCNEAFGLVVNPAGDLTVQGWCDDFSSGDPGTGEGWLIQSAVVDNGQMSHYRDGTLIDTRIHSYDTVLSNLVIGAELDGTPHVDMQVAAVLVYNRALSSSEQDQVLAYLQGKYFSGSGNQPPVANDDSAAVSDGGVVVIDVLNNDSDDGALDPATVVPTNPADGSISVDPVTGAVTYTHDGSGPGTDSFTYVVNDDTGLTSSPATVTVTVSQVNQPPVAVDDSATVKRGQTVQITVLDNDTDDSGIDPATVEIMTAAASGAAFADPVTGIVTYQHDGIDLAADSFTYRVADGFGLFSGEATVSVTVEEINASVTITAPTEGETVASGDVTVNYELSGDDFDHLHLSLDGNGHSTIMDLTGTYTFTDVAAGPHTITATLVNAGHQPVNGPESEDAVTFTADDCFPDAFAPNCTVDTDGDGTPDSVEGATTDSDGDGTEDYLESSVADADADGTADQNDADDANPCIPTVFGSGCTFDTDLDGIPDSVEGETADEDGDGQPNYLESSTGDTDGDGVADQSDPGNIDPCVPSQFGNGCGVDTDGDGKPDSLEGQTTDSDGDGSPDYLESAMSDQDADGTPDELDAGDADACVPSVFGNGCDVDSDGDGTADSVEGETTDSDGDGIEDYRESATNDADGDGVADQDDVANDDNCAPSTFADGCTFDTDSDGIVDRDEGETADSDGDGTPDYLESSVEDADGDGTSDQNDPADDNACIPSDTAAGCGSDTDADGIADVIEVGPDSLAPRDSDADGAPDFIDSDSDNDGLPDELESLTSVTLADADADSDGIDDAIDVDATGGTDADGDGVDDAVQPADSDSDGLPDYRDPDSDDDGTLDFFEGRYDGTAAGDHDADGIPDYLDLDTDRDGLADATENERRVSLALADSDGDGIDDALDADSTGGADANGDGVDDALAPVDTDGDTVPDYRDLDSDNDSRPDVTEAGLPDDDGDALADTGYTIVTNVPDTDGDGIFDFRDLDSDGPFDITTHPDAAILDANNDGMIDDPADADNDGLADGIDGRLSGFGSAPLSQPAPPPAAPPSSGSSSGGGAGTGVLLFLLLAGLLGRNRSRRIG